jgi:cobyrinic acid a,c-diamide synthase
MTATQTPPRLIIAGTHSGVGKTTIAIGIMAALRRRGLDVCPFKAGPDYIDPSYHRLACGRASGTLDSWMLGQAGLVRSYLRTATGDIVVIEGMMGLHDGARADSDAGSTAEIAKLISCPVILVLDGSSLARSAGAIVRGYKDFDSGVNVAGVIVNRVAGEGHAAFLRPAIRRSGAAFLGWVPVCRDNAIPERHLGLVMPDAHAIPDVIDRLATHIADHIDLDELVEIARSALPLPAAPQPANRIRRSCVRIAVASDDAFCFYYPDNLALLERAGAQIVPFSPMRDSSLPPGTDGLYFGGGYPEVHAAQLSRNRRMRDAIAAADRAGIPIFAECGGYMYLCERLIDLSGEAHEMAGLIPGQTRMFPTLQAIGYRDIRFNTASPLGPAACAVRGHEFRYSRYEGPVGDAAPFATADALHGYIRGNLAASYLHLHFGSRPVIARNWVAGCIGARVKTD